MRKFQRANFRVPANTITHLVPKARRLIVFAQQVLWEFSVVLFVLLSGRLALGPKPLCCGPLWSTDEVFPGWNFRNARVRRSCIQSLNLPLSIPG